MTSINVLVAVSREKASRYYKGLSNQQNFQSEIVSAIQDVLDTLTNTDKHIDVLILDNGLGAIHELIEEVRLTHPRLFIVLVDEDADFGTPGQADEFTTA